MHFSGSTSHNIVEIKIQVISLHNPLDYKASQQNVDIKIAEYIFLKSEKFDWMELEIRK